MKEAVAKKKSVVAKKTSKKVVVKKAATAKVVVPAAQKSIFYVSLKLDSNVLKSEGESIIECLDALHPVMIKTKGVLTVSFGAKSKETVLRPIQIKQLLAGKLNKEIFEKRMLGLVK